jgi:hypothetical protein
MSAPDDEFAPSAGSGTGDPRIGGISREEAAMLKQLAESMGALDCMPAWMRAEIEAKTKPPNDKLNLKKNSQNHRGQTTTQSDYVDGAMRLKGQPK